MNILFERPYYESISHINVAMKAFGVRLVVHGLVKCTDYRVAQRERNVAYAHAIQVRVRMRLLVCCDLLCDFAKQIGVVQVGVVHVRCGHSSTSPS